jgi:tetratricopeptide (TPR) repeat protein
MSDRETLQIEAALDGEDWLEAERLIARALESSPDDHWLVTRMGAALNEQHEYKKALVWSRKAMALAPECPLVLWDYAGALDMNRQEREAIAIWQRLLDRGVGSVANDECGEGKRWADALLNDCRYRIGLSYLDLGERAKGLKYVQEHQAHRRPGRPSLYTLAEVRAALRKAQSARKVRSTLRQDEAATKPA